MPGQSAVSVRASVLDGSLDAVEAALADAKRDVLEGTTSLATIGGVHFARLLIVPGDADVQGLSNADVQIPGDADVQGRAIPDSVMYMADLDESPDRHLRALSAQAGAVLDAVFSHCEGYPAAPDPAQRYTWLCAHEIVSAASYVNTIGRGVEQIVQEAGLHDWLEVYLDAHRSDLSALSPADVHRSVRTVVEHTPQVRFAIHPAPTTSTASRVRALLQVAASVAVVIVASPVLLVVGIPWVLAVHVLEMTDSVSTRRPGAASVDRLRAQEDQFSYNPFAAVGVIKPGSLRRRTVAIVLRAIAFSARHVFNKGSLAGVTTIHFARWVVLDDQQRVVFTSYYDGSLESYMDDFIDKIAWGLNIVFSNGSGYPRARWLVADGARDELAFKDYLRCHQLGTAVSYAAYPTLTTSNIINNAEIRAGLTRDLSDVEASQWLARL